MLVIILGIVCAVALIVNISTHVVVCEAKAHRIDNRHGQSYSRAKVQGCRIVFWLALVTVIASGAFTIYCAHGGGKALAIGLAIFAFFIWCGFIINQEQEVDNAKGNAEQKRRDTERAQQWPR